MKLKGFSLLETILVLAILAILMGLGWAGLLSFRSTAEMQNAYSELVSVIKSEQNKAKNSVSATNQDNKPTNPYFYALFFANNKYYAFNCGDKSTKFGTAGTVSCTKDTSVTFRALPSEIKITPDSSCGGIGFVKLTGKFITLLLPSNSNIETTTAFSTQYNTTGSCNIKIGHNSISTEKLIGFNLDLNNLNVN